ncbi:MAG: leucine--tRNA ligase [Candidatus Yanofskybacteria bacterium]|nr:leucine--tRNA ligase [Candidatus Yanofskybacteria bacterium]
MGRYNPLKIEKKWQKYWQGKKLFQTKDTVKGKENFMLLTEFPYPSGNLHIGHWYAFAVPDIFSRYLRMRGKNVLYPIGFDAFGLPAENAAIKNKINPKKWTEQNIAYMTKQLQSMGATFDWSRKVSTIDPEYYKWTQWFFIQLFKKGLAYRAKTLVNWCPKDKTVLANEQVINGCCDRCGTEVVQKELAQWMFKTTDYADKLIDDLEKLDWPEVTKTAQKNWVGRSRGVEVNFLIPNSKEMIKVFTTRADTLFGATYLVLAPEHSLVTKLTTDDNLDKVNKYIQEARKKTELERTHLDKDKTGVFTGAYVVNPVNKEKIPVWVADYVIGQYGTGAVMAVPAHDERDFEFAKKYNLPVKMVICPNYPAPKCPVLEKAFTDDAYLVDSGEFTGMTSEEGRNKILEKLRKEKLAESKINYKLHDWVISRQRYWGAPIPMIHCSKCARLPARPAGGPDGQGYQPVPEKELPVKLPDLEDFKPTTDGRSPLAKAKEWLKTKCPKCGKDAERETDTMDTFVDSSWYFLRYVDPKNKKSFADAKKMKQWLPVRTYVGGAEHNTMHLLYSRFFTKALFDLGLVDFNEPFLVRRNHGVILGPDSQKMSKSKGNVVDPDDLVKKYGADAVRMYLAFMGPYEQGGPWSPGSINGVFRFLNRVWSLFEKTKIADKDSELEGVLNRSIKKTGEDIENLHFNTGVSELMKLLNKMEESGGSKKDKIIFLKLLAPFAPHLAEEIWFTLLKQKKSIHLENWPKYDEKFLKQEKIDLIIQINGRVKGVLKIARGVSEEETKTMAMSSEKVKPHLLGKTLKRVIFIPDRLINLVV